jgi:magnesium transporter
MARVFFKKKLLGMESIPQADTHTHEEKQEEVKITVIKYDIDFFEETQVEDFEACIPLLQAPHFTWINIDGHPSQHFLEAMRAHFHLHPLLIEDISTEQRPKIEPYDQILYIVVRSLYYNPEKTIVDNEQVSLIVGEYFLISFQEREHHISTYIKERIRNRKNRLKNIGSDYLMYTFIDVIVDNYFIVLEKIAETVDLMEDELLSATDPLVLREIHLLKREIIIMRKSIWPLREVISKLQRDEFDWISPNINLYLRDLYDHTIQVIDTIETFRDMISGTLDLYLSNIGQKTNDIMKLLALAATIFAPLTFMTGIWGMNFKNMPELDWMWGYPASLSVMCVIIIIMVIYFKKKKWL